METLGVKMVRLVWHQPTEGVVVSEMQLNLFFQTPLKYGHITPV